MQMCMLSNLFPIFVVLYICIFILEPGRNSAKGPVKISRDLISLPRNDFRHIGHVGADGSIYGDIGFSLEGEGTDNKRGNCKLLYFIVITLGFISCNSFFN